MTPTKSNPRRAMSEPVKLASEYHLSDADRARFGIEPGWRFAMPRKVRWRELDPFGHANHITYLEYFEDARNAYLELVGLPRLGYQTPGPVLARVDVRYFKALGFGDRVLVTARTKSLKRSGFVMEYAVWREGCHALGSALCVLVDNATGDKVAVPEAVRAAMVRLDDPERLDQPDTS